MKQLKLGIVHLLFSSPASLVPEREKCCIQNTHAPVCRIFSGDDHFELLFERTFDLPCALFAGKTEGAECTSCWMPFVGACAIG